MFLQRITGNIWAVLILSACSLSAAEKKPAQKGYWVTIDRVVDGDTYWAAGIKYREAKIDTPETWDDPRHGYKCDAERRLGELATQRAEQLLLNRKIWIKPSGKDRYGRTLARARIGRSNDWYDERMISERLAARWQGRKHKWCEALGQSD